MDRVTVRGLSASERSPRWRRRVRLRERLALSLTLIPAVYLLAAAVLGIVVPEIDRSRGRNTVLDLDPDSARSILEAVAAGMITFAGLVVSIAVLVIQFGAGQYSPRLVLLFRRDPVVKNALGLFVAPGLFALVAVGPIGAGNADVRPDLTVIVALLLMTAALLALFGFIGRLLDLLRPRQIYAHLVERANAAIDDVYPAALGSDVERVARPRETVTSVVDPHPGSGGARGGRPRASRTGRGRGGRGRGGGAAGGRARPHRRSAVPRTR